MRVFYFDNFRGFNKTYLPLKNVNFFVGENSSGKTSVLKLIKIMSEHRFWFMNDFNSEEADLGYYSEIASYANKKRKDFIIGYLSSKEENKNDNENEEAEFYAIKLVYENRNGLPFAKEIFFINEALNLQIVIEKHGVKYRYAEVSINKIKAEERSKYLIKWMEDNGLARKTYTKEDKSLQIHGLDIFFYFQAILSQIKDSLKNIKPSRIYLHIPSDFSDIAWLAPIRTNPKRTYDSHKLTFNPDGTHAPFLLKKLLDKNTSEKKKIKIRDILKKFGQESGLFDDIVINKLGKNEFSPFELQVILNNQPLKITNVGYGVSQILPLVIEIMARTSGTWFALQQPEIHLHPKGQAAFGDLIFEAANTDRKNFIIETHSDYLIDRYRLKQSFQYNEPDKENIESQIIFFNRKNGQNELICIPINKDGTLPDNLPVEFRGFFIKEKLSMLNV